MNRIWILVGVAVCAVPVIVFLRVRSWLRLAATADGVIATDLGLVAHNERFYNELWREAELIAPQRFNTWPLVSRLSGFAATRLEIGPGLRPRLPIEGTHFLDLSGHAVEKLRAAGGLSQRGDATGLPFGDEAFDLVCALDIIEHVDDDERAFAELARVTRHGGQLLLSVPLHDRHWTQFDDFVGHGRRYEPADLLALLTKNGFRVERSAVYGMAPRSPRLVEFGIRCLLRRPRRAMWYYSRIFMPLGLWFQSRLRDEAGMIDLEGVDEVLLVCRREN